ncbi:hypothetical protein R1A27_32825 (plasmid) [Methylobacterium sp. NMS12]|uniref:hypothetical protein n=1 Tax=Methylobacterium sp. NMS12 TaxID=3079766 RepID=UPI003F884F48
MVATLVVLGSLTMVARGILVMAGSIGMELGTVLLSGRGFSSSGRGDAPISSGGAPDNTRLAAGSLPHRDLVGASAYVQRKAAPVSRLTSCSLSRSYRVCADDMNRREAECSVWGTKAIRRYLIWQ